MRFRLIFLALSLIIGLFLLAEVSKLSNGNTITQATVELDGVLNEEAETTPVPRPTKPQTTLILDDSGGASFTSTERGQRRDFALSMTEGVVRLPTGEDQIVQLEPPATPTTLARRLSEIDVANRALPVCYEVGKPQTAAYRRIITADITIRYDQPETTPELPQGLTLKERPSYAPEFAIVSAKDPFAALDQIDAVRISPGVIEAEVQLAVHRRKRALPNDTLITDQWHLESSGSAVASSDINVENAWLYGGSGGVRGSGVRIGIVDDGLQASHPDLAANADTVNDRDWNGDDFDASPNPANADDHGTACAGVAGAVGNNGVGVSGVAPEATLVGMRLVAAGASDSEEAEAMSYLPDLIHIKSNSWGPNDDGETLEAPGPLTRAAFASAAAAGRGGLGTIFVWAGGNGLVEEDNSNYDGYANDIHTIAVGASDSTANQSSYSESGANLVVCAPSDGVLGITTTDLTGSDGYASGNYTNDFGGTSSATPTVAGVIALMLEKNPGLGWRDVQEILIASAFKIDPTDSDWTDNAAGFHFNHKYGAGRVDATAAVALADGWTNLPAAISSSVAQSELSIAIPDDSPTGVSRSLVLSGANLRCEQVTLTLSATHSYRGDLAVTLTSPSGTVSQLAETHGDPGSNYSDWTFSSVRHWGEDSNGTWIVNISDGAVDDIGTLTALTLTAHGSSATPVNPGPVVQIDTPTNGSTFSPGASVNVTLSASDLDIVGDPGTVASVELFDNGSSVGIDTSAPFTFTLSPSLGDHALSAIAIDSEGASTTSSTVNFSVVNQPPVITAADLTPAPLSFSDETLSVTGLTAIDPESAGLTFSYLWESSDDGITWNPSGFTTDTIAPSPSLEGLLWRCRITANDGTESSSPFLTTATNILQRPPASVAAGTPFSYLSGLVLRGSESTLSRDAIINEFSQGVSGSSEWVELLVLRETSLRNWKLADSNGTPLVFTDTAAWDAIPAGTLILIYNGSARDSVIPADDSDPSDGTLIVSSDDTGLFTGGWPGYANSGDFVEIQDASDTALAAFSYGSNSARSPQLGAIGSGTSVYYTGSSDTGADSASSWKTTDSSVVRHLRTPRVPTSLPINFGGPWSPLPTGFTGNTTTYSSSLGGDSSPGSARFDSSGESLTIEFSSAAGAVNYHLRGNASGTDDTQGTFIVEESSDNASYTPLRTHTNLSNTDTLFSDTPASTTRFIRFRYETKTSGNIQLDALEITNGGSGDDLALAVTPTTFPEGAGTNAATGTVSIPNSLGTDLTVMLSSSETSAATVPASVVILAGQTSQTFAVAAIDDSDSDGVQLTSIVASASAYTSASIELSVTDDEVSFEGVTPAAGNNPANGSFATDLSSGAFNSPALFRLATGITLPAGLSLDPASGLLSGTVSPGTAAGNYPITIERYNSFAEVVSQSFTLEVTSNGGYVAWIAGEGVAETDGDDDPDHDGIENLLEYYLDGQADTSDPSILPQVALDGAAITFTFWHLKSATDVTAIVEWSDTLLLNSWSTLGVTTEVITDEPTREQIRATIPANSATKRFVRLRIEAP